MKARSMSCMTQHKVISTDGLIMLPYWVLSIFEHVQSKIHFALHQLI